MDHFWEEVATSHRKTFETILYVFATISMVVFGFIGLLTLMSMVSALSFDLFNIIVAVVGIGVGVLLYLNRDKVRTEYEYTFTNGDLDFAQVFNNKKRKPLGTIKVATLDTFGPVDSNHFNKVINTPNLKKRNWFVNRDANLYYFYFQKEDNKNILVFEPSDELVALIKRYLPRGAYQE